MPERKPQNEGNQPSPKNNKETFGYQPGKIEKGYQPQPIQQTGGLNPPSGGSNVRPSGSE